MISRRSFLGAALAAPLFAQGKTLRIIGFGAHPDDAEIRAGGCAALWSQLGHKVKFVATTNGDAGHPVQGGGCPADGFHEGEIVKAEGVRMYDDGFGERTIAPETVVEVTRRAGFSSCEEIAGDELWRRYLPGAPHPNAFLMKLGTAVV